MLRTIQLSLSSTLTSARKHVQRFFSQREAIRSPRRPRTRLVLETLEDRIVPTTWIDSWTATSSGDWSNPANWTDDQGNHRVPDQNAQVVFGLFGQTTGNCTMSIAGGTTVNSLTIFNTYTKILTLNTTLTIQDNGDGTSTGLTVNGISNTQATISQPNGTSSDINLYGPLNWSYGVIGSQTGGASDLNLNAGPSGISTCTIGPTGGSSSGQETLGDNLNINSGVTVTVANGGSSGNNLIMNNNANINNQRGTLILQALAMGITNASGSNGSLLNGMGGEVYAGGNVGGGGTGGSRLQCIPVVNGMGGGFWVGGDNGVQVLLEITGTNPQNGVSFLNNGGGVTLYTGSYLIARGGFTQQAGGLDIVGATGLMAYLCTDNSNPNLAAGNVVINGGYVGFAYANQALEVGHNFSMTGGSVNFVIDATAVTYDFIYSYAGNITINNGCTITVDTINVPPQGMPDKNWILFAVGQLANGSVTVGQFVRKNFLGDYGNYTWSQDQYNWWLHSYPPGS